MKSDTDQSGTMRLAAQNKQKPGPGLHNEEGKWKRPLFRKLSNDVALFISLDNAWTESLKRERSLAALTPGVCSSGAWGFFPCCGVLSLAWVFFFPCRVGFFPCCGVLCLPWGSFPVLGFPLALWVLRAVLWGRAPHGTWCWPDVREGRARPASPASPSSDTRCQTLWKAAQAGC